MRARNMRKRSIPELPTAPRGAKATNEGIAMTEGFSISRKTTLSHPWSILHVIVSYQYVSRL